MPSSELIPALRSVLEREPALRVAYLFGSLGRGDASEGSDVDVAVLAASQLGLGERARLAEDLSRALEFRRSVDVVDLRSAPPLLAAEVVRDGVLLIETLWCVSTSRWTRSVASRTRATCVGCSRSSCEKALVVIREEALAERLALLRSTVLRLQAAAGRTLDDDWDEWALERGLQLAAQALFDVGNHVLAGTFAWRPKDYAEVAPELARRGVIGSNLEQRLRGLAPSSGQLTPGLLKPLNPDP